MKRWTVLLIPHDTEEPRTFAVSARALRAGAVAMVAVGVCAFVGVVLVVQRLAAPDDAELARRAMAGAVAPAPPPGGSAVDSLRATVEALYGALDTIRQVDRRLSEAAGLAPNDSVAMETQAALAGTRATADSLLRGATRVAGQLGALADSAQDGRGLRGSGLRPSKTSVRPEGAKK